MSRPVMYQVIYEDLAKQISSGALSPDDRLPSEAALADQYGVSRMTVRQALGQLEAKQLLVRRRGAGTYIADRRVSTFRRVNKLGPFKDDIGLGNVAIRTQIQVQEVVAPPEEIRVRLGIKKRQQAIHLRRLRFVEATRAAIQDSWLSYAIAPGLARGRLVGGSLYRTLSEKHGIDLLWAEQEVSASAATDDQAELLHIQPGSPLLCISRLTFGEGPDAIEYANSYTLPEFPLLIRLDR